MRHALTAAGLAALLTTCGGEANRLGGDAVADFKGSAEAFPDQTPQGRPASPIAPVGNAAPTVAAVRVEPADRVNRVGLMASARLVSQTVSASNGKPMAAGLCAKVASLALTAPSRAVVQ